MDTIKKRQVYGQNFQILHHRCFSLVVRLKENKKGGKNAF